MYGTDIKRKPFWWLAAAILLAAAVLRLYNLGGPELWMDEQSGYWTAGNSYERIVEMKWERRSSEQPDPPLSALLAGMLLVGVHDDDPSGKATSSRFRFRLTAALAGWLAVVAAALIALRLADRRTALLTAAFLGLFFYGVYYSREGRPYALILLFATLAAGAVAELARHPKRWWPAGLLGVSLAGAAYSHYFAGFLYFVAAGWIAAFLLLPGALEAGERRPFFWRAGAGFLLGCALYAPWMPVFVWVVEQHFDAGDLYGYSGTSPAMGLRTGTFWFDLLGRWTVGVGRGVLGLELAIIGALVAWRRFRPAAALLLPWLLLPWLVWPWLPGSGQMHFRYLIFTYPAYCMLMAMGLVAAVGWLQEHNLLSVKRWVAPTVLVLIVFLLLVRSFWYLPEPILNSAKCIGDPPYPESCQIFIE
ncbi:MAG: glycosyltransferase family 39 protein [Candidatus Lernaella stagnicola]|nr:glycosyltransferase family 39 protein [Candidatus Lernaella stagnicola]